MDKAISILANNLNRDYYDLISRYREVLKHIGTYSFENKVINPDMLLINDYNGNEYRLNGFEYLENTHITLNVYNIEGGFNVNLPIWEFENLPIYQTILNEIQAIEFPIEEEE